MTPTQIIYLSKDRKASKERHFLRRALELGRLYQCDPIPSHDGASLLEACAAIPKGTHRLIFVCHGGPTWFLRSDRGCHRWRHNPPRQVSVSEVADVLSERMGVEYEPCRIVLAACLTGRSPRWYLTEKYGRIVSPWGPESYLAGGEASIAALLRDAMCERQCPAVVSGHVVAGEALSAPLGRTFHPIAGTPGDSWWTEVTGLRTTSLLQRRQWVRAVKRDSGRLAQRLLLDGATPDTVAACRAALVLP